MYKSMLVLLILWLPGEQLFAQDRTKNFEIVLPGYKIPNSLYNKISYVDSRAGKKEIGMVDVGLLRNTEAKLVLQTPLTEQLTAVINALTDSSASDGELLFQLHWLRFGETVGTRYCYLIADLYAKNGVQYAKMATIDTVLLFKTASVNVLINEESKLLTGFIANNLLNQPKASVTYTLAEVARIDSIEMQKIPLFIKENYTDGLYETYKSFEEQTPDKQAIVNAAKDGSISSVRVVDSSGEKVKIHSKNVYALVYKGQPYMATPYGYYLLQKSADNNFYFTGDIKVAFSEGERAASQFAVGLIGTALTGSGNQETFVVMIDYRNGGFIHLQKVVKPEEN